MGEGEAGAEAPSGGPEEASEVQAGRPPVPGAPGAGDPPHDPAPVAAEEPGTGRSKRRLVVGAAIVVLAAVGVVVGLVVSGTAASLLVDGHGTATITWSSTGNGLAPGRHQDFAGTVDSVAVTGAASGQITPSAGQSIFGDFSFDVRGTAGGTPFSLVARPQLTATPGIPLSATFEVTGHYGRRTVTGALTFRGSAPTFGLTATIGGYRIRGQVDQPVEGHGKETATASFDVTGG